MKRKSARPWQTRVSYRGLVHRVSRSSGGVTPWVTFACEDVMLSAGFRLVPDQVQFVIREVDCMACLAEGSRR